jgi:hypothetical protein
MAQTRTSPSDSLPLGSRRRGVLSNAPKSVVAGAALAGAVGVTTVNGGGFDASSQAIFVALAGVALLAGAMPGGVAVSAAARSSFALALVGIAALSLLSAAWTVDGRTTAIRSGLVVAGYAAVFVTAAGVAKQTGPGPFATAIAALAFLEAILGLHAVAMHSLPDAERIDGAWRPGGTFEYPPALVILEISALPALGSFMNKRSFLVAGGAAAAATLAGAMISLSGSRLGLAMTALLLALMILRPADDQPRSIAAVATATFVAVGGLIATTALGGHVSATTPGASWSGVAKMVAVAMALGVLWLLMRQAAAFRDRPWLTVAVCFTAIAIATSAWAIHNGAPSPSEGAAPDHGVAAVHQHGDFLHGRGREWSAALQTWSDHPLLGAGAGAYYTASLSHQGSAPTRYAHDLPVELAAELGVIGLLLGIVLYASAAQLVSRAINTPGLWLLAPCVVVFLASNLVDWTWHLAGLTALWAAAAGALQGSASLPAG